MDEKEEKEIKEEIKEVKEALKWLSRKSAEKMYKIDSRVQKQIKIASDRMSKHLDDVDKDRRRKMQEIRYVGIEFDPVRVKQGQAEVNTALKSRIGSNPDFKAVFTSACPCFTLTGSNSMPTYLISCIFLRLSLSTSSRCFDILSLVILICF
jgi:hypothetical protein